MKEIFHRTSIRNYTDQPVEKEKVLQIPDRLYAFAFIACGYPAEEKKQQDRYDESRIHYV